MEKFTYKAKDNSGRNLTGIVEAFNKESALKILHEKQLVVYYLKKKHSFWQIKPDSKEKRIKKKEICHFTRQLAVMINSGLSLANSLAILEEQTSSSFKNILQGIRKKIEAGDSFYTALSNWNRSFSQAYLALVKSAEASGRLDKVLLELADSLEKQLSFQRKIISALIYPAIVFLGMIGVMMLMMVFIIPQLMQMYKEMEVDLPFLTKWLIKISTFINHFWLLFFFLGIGGVFLFLKWYQTNKGKEATDKIILRLPIIGNLVSKIALTRISRSLSMLINAGVPIIECLDIVAETGGNAVYSLSLNKIIRKVEKGVSLHESLAEFPEYPQILVQMVLVGEQTGKVGEVLLKVADYFEQETEEAIKGLTTAIEPFMMILLGIGVAFIVFAIITPIYKLTSHF